MTAHEGRASGEAARRLAQYGPNELTHEEGPSAADVSGCPFSVAVTLIALALFGYVKGHFTGTGPGRGALQIVLIDGLAAAAAFAIARAIA